MSRENVEVASQWIEAFNRRDLEAMTERFAPEIEWVPGGPAAVERSVYRGLDEVAAGFAATWESWDEFEVEERELRDLGESILWLGRARLRGRTSHVELDQEFAIHMVMRDAKVTRLQGFVTWDQALRAVALRE